MRAAESPLPNGRLGRFEILEVLRAGGQGLVFKARDPATRRLVALKRLVDGCFSSGAARRRFEREIDLLVELDHPNIVAVHGAEEIDGVPVLVLEWIDGQSITEWSRRLPEGRSWMLRRVAAFRSVCAAICHAHQHGVLHRDLKPSNVLVDAAERPRVLDFGLARRIEAADETAVTRTIGFVGTPAYASPESFTSNTAPLDVLSDVYSLGILFHEILTGQRAFAQTGLRELITAIENDEPKPPSSLARGIPRALDAVVAKAAAKRRGDRYATVHALLDDVDRFLAGAPVEAARPSWTQSGVRWILAHRVAAGSVLAIALAAIAAVAAGTWHLLAVTRERTDALVAAARADQATDRAREIYDFYLGALIHSATPNGQARSRDMLDVLEYAGTLVDVHFRRHPDAALETYLHLARALRDSGKAEAAARLVGAARTLHDRLPAVPVLLTARLLHAEGMELVQAGQRTKACERLVLAQEAFLRAERSISTSAEWSVTVRALAELEWRAGRLDAAEAAFRDVIAFFEASPEFYGHDYVALDTRKTLGKLLLDADQPAAAESLLRDTLAAAAETCGPDDVLRADLSTALANVLRDRGEFDRAIELRREALRIERVRLPAGHPELGWSLYRCGRELATAGRGAEAEPLLAEAAELGRGTPLELLGRIDLDAIRGPGAASSAQVDAAALEAVLSLEQDPGTAVQVALLAAGSLARIGATERAADALELCLRGVRAAASASITPNPRQRRLATELGALLGRAEAVRAAFADAAGASAQ